MRIKHIITETQILNEIAQWVLDIELKHIAKEQLTTVNVLYNIDILGRKLNIKPRTLRKINPKRLITGNFLKKLMQNVEDEVWPTLVRNNILVPVDVSKIEAADTEIENYPNTLNHYDYSHDKTTVFIFNFDLNQKNLKLATTKMFNKKQASATRGAKTRIINIYNKLIDNTSMTPQQVKKALKDIVNNL